MADAPKLKCTLDLRDVPPSAFRMLDDGRQWRHKCELRCALLHWLTTFADADGSNVEAGIKRMEARFEVSRRTVFRRLDDLMELGFITREKLTGFKGTRRRTINVAAILSKAAVVPSSPNPVVPSTPSDVPSTRVSVVPSSLPDVPSSLAEVPSSHPVVPKSAGFGTQPSLTVHTDLPSFQTGQENGGLEGWILKNLATMGQPNETTQTWLQKQSAERGQDVLLASLDKFLIRPSGFFRVTNPWALFISESARLIESALQDAKAADERARLSAATDAYVRQQQDAHAKFMEYEPPRPSEVDPDECMAEKSR